MEPALCQLYRHTFVPYIADYQLISTLLYSLIAIYIDAAWSVCLLVTTKSCAKTAEPIKIPSGMWTRVGPRNLVLGGGPDLPKEGANLGVVLSHWKRIVTARAPKQ